MVNKRKSLPARPAIARVRPTLPAPGQSKPLDDSTLLKVPLAHVLEVKSGAAW